METPSSSMFRVVILSGPSGSGKTTIVDRVIARSPVPLVKSISATTRPPRTGERHGEAYYFLSPEEFSARRTRGEFLETAEVFRSGYWYGTLASEVDRARTQGGWSFLEIDVEGALKVMELHPEAISIFLKTPSNDVFEQRLRARGTESEETIQRRLAQARNELLLADRYRHQVVNDDLDRAVDEIVAILAAARSEEPSAP